MDKLKYRLPLVLIAVMSVAFIAAAIVISVRGKEQAQPITAGGYFAQAQKLSKGTRPACLNDNKKLDDQIDKLQTADITKSFGFVVSNVFLDMPAGYTDTYVSSYDGKTARGTVIFADIAQRKFAGNDDSYNFVVSRNSSDNTWKLQSFIACAK